MIIFIAIIAISVNLFAYPVALTESYTGISTISAAFILCNVSRVLSESKASVRNSKVHKCTLILW